MSRAELEAIRRRAKWGYVSSFAINDLKHGLRAASRDVNALLVSHENLTRFVEAILAPTTDSGVQGAKGGTDETTGTSTSRSVRARGR